MSQKKTPYRCIYCNPKGIVRKINYPYGKNSKARNIYKCLDCGRTQPPLKDRSNKEES